MADEDNKLQTAAESRDQTRDFSISSEKLRKLLSSFDECVETARTGRERWATQIEENHKWRKGRVGRPHPNLPFKGAADIRFPFSDSLISELKPIYSNSIRSATRPVRVLPLVPQRYEAAQKIEHWFAHVLRSKVKDWEGTTDCNADNALESGSCILKVTWNQRREPVAKVYLWEDIDELRNDFQRRKSKILAGQDIIPQELTDEEFLHGLAMHLGMITKGKIDPIDKTRLQECIRFYNEGEEGQAHSILMDELTHNEPVIQNVDMLQSIIVPLDATANIQEAEWISHDMPITERELIENSAENGGRYQNVHDLLESVKSAHEKSDLIKHDKPHGSNDVDEVESFKDILDETEGLSPNRELRGCLTLREHYCWLPRYMIQRWRGQPGDDETPVRAVVSYLPTMPKQLDRVLLMRELPYDHRRWPFANYQRKRGKNRFYSGVGVPEEVNALEKEYNIQKNGAINRDWWSSSPPILTHSDAKISLSMYRQLGQEIPVRGGIDPRMAAVPLQLPEVSSTWNRNADEMLSWGQRVVGVPNLQSVENYGNPPTAEQVQRLSAPADTRTMWELGNFQGEWAEAYTQIFLLARQYLFSGNPEEQMMVPNSDNPKDEMVAITKDDFQGDFIIRPGGDVTLESPMLKAQKTAYAIQFAMGNKAFMMGTKPYDALNLFMSRFLGYDEAQIIMRDRKSAEQMDQAVLQMAAQMAAQEAAGKKGRGAQGGGQQPQLPSGFTGIAPKGKIA